MQPGVEQQGLSEAGNLTWAGPLCSLNRDLLVHVSLQFQYGLCLMYLYFYDLQTNCTNVESAIIPKRGYPTEHGPYDQSIGDFPEHTMFTWFLGRFHRVQNTTFTDHILLAYMCNKTS